ncbi:MAG: glycoside hydrolase family 88 protein [Ferruginibacter sp.]
MKFLPAVLLFLLVAPVAGAQQINYSNTIADAEKQTELMIEKLNAAKAAGNNPSLVSPRSLDKNELRLVTARDWTSGFFPGELWMLYEATGKAVWKTKAELFTKEIEGQQFDRSTHDLGFKVYCSVGAGYAETGNEHYKAVLVQTARTLSARFNANTGTIKSWDHMKQWDYPVIIDNMMNLELLFAATRLTGDSSFYKIAVSHANATIKNHFREDNSSFHVVDYDSLQPGKIRSKNTHQGYADESAWARGQAWGLYGFTMCYRETGDKIYLQQAEKIAAFIFQHKNLPKDLIPYWDYNAPGIPGAPRDASAAAITASALYELSQYSQQKKNYLKKANAIVKNLTRKYRSALGENEGFILLHSTGHKPAGTEIDVPIIYADYYYLEALLRGNKLQQNKKLFNP